MFHHGNISIGISLIVFLIATSMNDCVWKVTACDLDQATSGCRIDNGACSCGYGCKSEFRYESREQCTKALKGRSNDVCGRVNSVCLNEGSCIQISQSPGFRCKCEGTGYWGERCHLKCSDSNTQELGHFPYECVVI